jgi:hypothetical protein
MASSTTTVSSAPAKIPKPKTELDKFKQELEKQKAFKHHLPLWTKVESWVLEEGQKGKDKINFGLWGNEPTANKNLESIFKTFPEFKTLRDSITSGDPKKEKQFTQILQERLQTKLKRKTKNREKLANLSEKVGKDWTKDVLDYGFEKFSKWKEEGPAGYAKIAGTGILLYFAVWKGLKTVWGTIKGTVGPGKPVISNLLVGGGLVAAAGYALKEVFNPRDANASESPAEAGNDIPLATHEAGTDLSKDEKKVEAIINSNEGAKAFMGLLHTPVKDVLEAYSGDRGINTIDPKFLLKHVQATGRFNKKWTKRMIKKIKPTALYDVVHSTISLFEHSKGYEEAKKKNSKLELVEYIKQEYVNDERTTIEFPELAVIAFEVGGKKYLDVINQKTQTETARKKVIKAITETRKTYSGILVNGIETTLVALGNLIYLPLEAGGKIIYDISTGLYEYGGKKYRNLAEAIKSV